jgi:hypothetical protein
MKARLTLLFFLLIGTSLTNAQVNNSVMRQVEIIVENGEKTVTITTRENGNETRTVLRGEDADAYLREQDQPTTGGKKQMQFQYDFDFELEDGMARVDSLMMHGFSTHFDSLFEHLGNKTMFLRLELDSLMDEMAVFRGVPELFRMGLDSLKTGFEYIDTLISLHKDSLMEWKDELRAGVPRVEIKKRIMVRSVQIEDVENQGMKEPRIDHFRFYPNPSNGNFTLELDMPDKGEAVIAITDLLGQEVYRETIKTPSYYRKELQLENLGAGTYFLSIDHKNRRVTKRIIIQ